MRKVPRQIADRLPAAADLFADKGLNDSKIEDVAAVTGVPKATLYYYFAGKEEILAFLLEDLLKDISDAVIKIVKTDGTGAERLELVIRAQLRAMAQRPAVCRALIGELGRAARMPAIAEMINTAYQKPVEALLVAGARDGSLVEQPDARSTSIALFGAVTINALMYLVTDHHLDETVVADTLYAVMFNGLRPRQGDEI
ncbi:MULTISPECIES: TetR/AcrR family transcriptional regulator [Mycobacteriaceae]|jgi:TetR/AcrR family transcriptional regulator|uniref:TetR/AcrR family transcriptional regulator n=1 Tax=Mycobacteriaceae TaxID=1762 RepID=UPI0009ACA868|nr:MULTISPECIES: TetR/AcrR family transcriptional regulator [Mycobacteriaceae]KAA0093614.1 TetR/AcrR family transcriptional regulator [Mycolicibacterium sp. P1-18]OPX08321.1 TetR family transcriptional regulator [Mycobacterium sp. AT1]